MAQSSKEGYSYDKNSKEVKKYGDFYVVNVKISLDNCDRISASKGSVYGHLFISGFNKAYKGSIYVDDVTLTVDKKSVVKQNYENGKTVVAGIILTDQKRNIHLQLFHSQERHWM